MDAVRTRSIDRPTQESRPAATTRRVIELPPSPRRAARAGGSLGMIMMPVAAGSGSLLLTVTNQGRPIVAAIGLMILIASVTVGILMVVTARTGARRLTAEQRERYLDVLDGIRSELHRARREQISSARDLHPPPSGLFDLARAAEDRWHGPGPQRGTRVGTGSVQPALAPRLPIPTSTVEHADDPVCAAAAEELVASQRTVADQPIVIPLDSGTGLTVSGPTDRARGLVRALLCRLAIDRPPGELDVMIACGAGAASEWSWSRYLPHVVDRSQRGPASGQRRVVDIAAAVDVLASASVSPGAAAARRIVVVDGDPAEQRAIVPPADVLVLRVVGAAGSDALPTDLCIELAHPGPSPAPNDTLREFEPSTRATVLIGETRFVADELDIATARSIARTLARHRRPDARRTGPPGRAPHSLPAALGITALAGWDAAAAWRTRRSSDLLRAPIGVTDDGETVTLDLRESAMGGMGPHGLLVGATGTGKSELLRTLVLGLAATHSPDEIAFLLVDFKGGAAFAPVARLPQVAGVVTNLLADDGLIDRVRDALRGEITARQRRLAAAGDLPDIHAYRRRAGGPGHDPMPRLLVIVDEFTELVTARPDMLDVFTAIGRIGRSLGIHLLIASQRLDAGRIRGLETHLSYRIALRTFSDLESREAIGCSDAFRLPDRPGSALLSSAGHLGARFRAFPVSARDPGAATSPQPTPRVRVPLPAEAQLGRRVAAIRGRRATATPAAEPVTADADAVAVAESDSGGSVLDVMTDRIATALARSGHPPARPIWLDPLPSRLPLAELLQLNPPGPGDPPAALIGLIDDPERQGQQPLRWSPRTGPLLIVGAARSGRSTAAAAVMVALAARCGPAAMAMYAIDAGGGDLARFDGLPHVVAIAPRSQPELLRRTVDELRRVLDTRDRPGPRDATGDALVVIDGWSAARHLDPSLDDALGDLLARGPGLGVHTVVTVSSTSELRARLAAGFAARIELRLSDPFESSFDRARARRMPAGTPGRALVDGGLTAQVAVPPDDRRDVDALCGHWAEPPAQRIRLLPDRVHLDVLLPTPGPPSTLTLGVSERDMRPVVIDLAVTDPSLLVAGDPGSGRTSVLRAIARQLTAAPANQQDRPAPEIYLVDVRRTLAGRTGVATDATRVAADRSHAAELAAALARRCGDRLRGAGDRSELVLLVDDYDLVAAGANPLLPLLPYLAHARDIGLRVVIARACGGLARARYEPVLQALCDLGTPLLLLSGDPAEGRLLHGLVPRPLPPGRARLGRRGRADLLIQTPWTEP